MNRRSKFTVIVAIYKIKHEKQKGELEINCLHYTLLIKRSMPWGQCCWIKSVQFQCHIATLSQNFSLFRVSGHHPKTCMTTHHTWTLSSTVQVREYVSLRTPLHVSSFVVDYLAIMLLKTCFYANIPCDSHPRKTDPVSIEKGL